MSDIYDLILRPVEVMGIVAACVAVLALILVEE